MRLYFFPPTISINIPHHIITMRQPCCHRFLMHAYWYELLVETQNIASHEQPIASLIHHKIPISNTQINRETQDFASLLFSNTNFNQQSSPHHHNAPALLPPFFGVCILVWIARETQNLASLLFSTNNFNQHSSPHHHNAPALLSVFFLQHALW